MKVSKVPDIALLPNKLLGDGIMALVLANNLYKNDFNLTVYHDYLYEIREWLPYKVLPSSNQTDIYQLIKQHDLVLSDTFTHFIENMSHEEKTALSNKIIYYSTGHLFNEFNTNNIEYFKNKWNPEIHGYLKHFKNAARKIKYNNYNSMVENFRIYCSDTLHLKNVSNTSGLSVSHHYTYMKFPKRVIIAPTSNGPKKEWAPKKFIALARKIKELGYQPVITLAPNEHLKWKSIIKGEFESPLFHSIKDFGAYLYESGLLIGCDSGPGHYASALGIPVLTIVNSPKKKNLRFRPGWNKVKVITPFYSFSLFGKRHWHPFLTTNKVLKEFETLISDQF